jgi:hypothetical protein
LARANIPTFHCIFSFFLTQQPRGLSARGRNSEAHGKDRDQNTVKGMEDAAFNQNSGTKRLKVILDLSTAIGSVAKGAKREWIPS